MKTKPAHLLTPVSPYRKFWRDQLIRLKYHNPSVAMTVTRSPDARSPALMTLHYTSAASPSSSSSSAPTPTTEVIDMKDLDESAILAQLLNVTKARPVRVTAEDARQTQELGEYATRNNHVRELMAAAMGRRRKEQEILKQARGEAEMLKSDE